MQQIIGSFETPYASKYLQQLCKHFQHKVDACYDQMSGHVALPCGDTVLTASETHLTAAIKLKDPADAEYGRQIIDNHLARFAFREGFETMDWSD